MSMQTKWQSEEIWREALWSAREQLRMMKMEGENAQTVARARSKVQRIRAAGLPNWKERVEWAGFSFPPSD